MDAQKEVFYIGIDLDDSWTQISYYREGMEDVETVSTITGAQKYRIPTVLGECQELILFLRRVLRFVPGLMEFSEICALTIHLREVDVKRVQLLRQVMEEIGIPRERVFIQDSKESFCHFALHQEWELMQHEIMLFQCEENHLQCYWLKKDEHTMPRKVQIQTFELGELPTEEEERDRAFMSKAEELLRGKIVSAVYLTGEGFEGEWMRLSVNMLCRGRRVFQGKNLYTKGACYESMMQMSREKQEYVYFSENIIADNIFIQVKNGNRTFFKELAEAGSSRFDVSGSCQVLLDGEPSVDIWLQSPDSQEARIVSLQLTDLPKRPPKATRLFIELMVGRENRLMVRVTDMGFGAWYPASGKVWEYSINE